MSTKSSPSKTASKSKPPAKTAKPATKVPATPAKVAKAPAKTAVPVKASAPIKAAAPVKAAAPAKAAAPGKANAPAKSAKVPDTSETISLQTWLAEIRAENLEEFKEIPDEQILAFIRNVFKQVCTCLEENDSGLIKVAGLGQFRITQAAESDAKRITFRLPPAK